jgi:hypothetical protein
MPRVGFEPTIPVIERVKTIHVLDGAATVIGNEDTTESIYACESCISWVEVNGSKILDLE